LLYYAPSLFGYPYPSSAATYSDIAITHLPNLIYLKNTLLAERAIPLWSSLIFSGTPFAANPLSGLWYPPGWLALFLPPYIGFSILAMTHVLFGGIGMALLLRKESLVFKACLLGALAFESLPKLMGHFGAGHLTLVYAVPWLPWLAWASIPPSSGKITSRFAILPGAILALIFLADPRWALYAGIFWLGWVFSKSRQTPVYGSGNRSKRVPFGRTMSLFAWVISQIALAFGLAAILAIPLAEFVSLSARRGLTIDEGLIFSLPPVKLLSLIFPDFKGNQELLIYAGSLIFILVVLAALWASTRKRAIFWLVALLVSLVFALGEYFPPSRWIAGLPTMNLLRVPARAIFITGISMAALAAFGLNRILVGVDELETRVARLALVGIVFFTIGLGVVFFVTTGSLEKNVLWGVVGITAAAIWIYFGVSGRIPGRLWFGALILFCLVDWAGINRTLLFVKQPSVVQREGERLARYIQETGPGERVYSPSYSLPQQTSALFKIEHADGVDPLYLENYARFMDSATGVHRQAYSVSIPPFTGGNPELDNVASLPDPDLLGELNVGYVVAAFDLNIDGLDFLREIDGVRVYKNRSVLPRAWVADEAGAVGNPVREAQVIKTGANQRLVRAEGPGLLVLSEVDYPGWTVRVDGRPVDGDLVDELFQGVSLDPGIHLVEFRFQPASFYLGLFICLFSLGVVVWLAGVKFRS
jgi:hypothetical protein